MAPRWCIYVAHNWRMPKIMWGLFILETPLTIGCLVVFALASPDTYRTRLWQNGSNLHFNSNPNEVLYSYANYEPIHTPLVWSRFVTQFNVVASVLSMFILLVKVTMFVLHGFVPLLSVFVHALLIAIYAVSVRNQSMPDLSNTKVENLQESAPWYLSKGCSFAAESNTGYCRQAQAGFALACVMLTLFVTYFGLAIWSSIITKAEKDEREAEHNEDIELKNARYTYDGEANLTKEERWERNRQIFLNLPKTPSTPKAWANNPMTPRTTAFTQLSGGDANAGGAGGGPSRPLALRQYGDREVRIPDPI